MPDLEPDLGPDTELRADALDGLELDDIAPPAAGAQPAPGSPAPPAPAPPPPHPDTSQTFMPNAITFAGLQHVISNLCHDVTASLSYWDEFFKMLKALEAFLRVEDYR